MYSCRSRFPFLREDKLVNGLEEKRGKANGPGIGRPRTRPEYPEVKLKRLEAENEMLKKLLQM